MTIIARRPDKESNNKIIAKPPLATTNCACGNAKEAGALSCPVCGEALRYYLDHRTKYEGLDEAKFLNSIRENHGIGVAGKCSLCEGNYVFGGNNPQPVIDDFDARCCDRCNDTVVSSARFDHIRKYGRAY